MALTYEPIATTTLTSNQSGVTFNSIPSTYTDLIVVNSVKAAASSDYFTIRLGNGSIDTGSNYSSTVLAGNGSGAYSYRYSNKTFIYGGVVGTVGSSDFVTYIFQVQNYSNSTTYKTVLTRANSTNGVEATVGLWRSTSTVNSVYIGLESLSWASGSTFTLYGIKSA